MQQHASAPLYNPEWEHDACGIGFVARLDGQRSHEIVELALDALCNLEHRGATDADGSSGDGAGVMTHLPYALLARHLRGIRLPMPAPENFAVAMCFLPAASRIEAVRPSSTLIMALLGIRKPRIVASSLGRKAERTRPVPPARGLPTPLSASVSVPISVRRWKVYTFLV